MIIVAKKTTTWGESGFPSEFLGFVLGNKVAVGTVNAGREHYQAAVQDMALAEAAYPGWLSRLLTHPVQGLDNYRQAFELLTGPHGPVKVYVEVALIQ